MNILFIGGPADGKWLDVSDKRDTYVVPSQAPHGLEKHTYVKEPLREGDGHYFVFVHPTCKNMIFTTLMRGYRPGYPAKSGLPTPHWRELYR